MKLSSLKDGQRFTLDGLFYRKLDRDTDNYDYVKCFDESSQEITDILAVVPISPVAQNPEVDITVIEPDDTITLARLPFGSLFTLDRDSSDLMLKVAACEQNFHVVRLQDMSPRIYFNCPVFWPNVTQIDIKVTLD